MQNSFDSPTFHSAAHSAVDFICKRRNLNGELAEEFRSWAYVKLCERKETIERQFRGDSALATYLTVVVGRLFCDYLVAVNGKWRVSQKASDAGPLVARLERLVYFEGLPLREAIAVVEQENEIELDETTLELFASLLPRPRPSFVELDANISASTLESDQLVREREESELGARIAKALSRVLDELSCEERVLLELRFRRGLRMSEVARRMRAPGGALYRQYDRVLRGLRNQLEAQGITQHDVAGIGRSEPLGAPIAGVLRTTPAHA